MPDSTRPDPQEPRKITRLVSPLKTSAPDRRQDALRTLRRRDVPHARRLALPGLRLQDRLLRLVNAAPSSRTSTPPIRRSRPIAIACSSWSPSCARATRRRARGRRREVPAAPPRAGQAAGARAHRAAARSRIAVSRAVAAGGLRHVRRRGAGGRHRHRHRPRLGARSADRRQRRDREGRHLLPDHGQEAPARAGDRARRTACRASTWSIRAARSCRCRPRSSPIAITSAASSSTRRACRPSAFRRSPS